MTREEAINAITVFVENYACGSDLDGLREAIESLKRPHGEWKNGVCTNCGAECFEDYYMRDIKTEFCHRCGADMRPKEGETE